MSTATQQLIIVLIVVLAIGVVIRFEMLCLSDIARTGDEEFRYLSRWGWIAITVLWIPIGGLLYLMYGKGRPRF